jgi:hypothetical protein
VDRAAHYSTVGADEDDYVNSPCRVLRIKNASSSSNKEGVSCSSSKREHAHPSPVFRHVLFPTEDIFHLNFIFLQLF